MWNIRIRDRDREMGNDFDKNVQSLGICRWTDHFSKIKDLKIITIRSSGCFPILLENCSHCLGIWTIRSAKKNNLHKRKTNNVLKWQGAWPYPFRFEEVTDFEHRHIITLFFLSPHFRQIYCVMYLIFLHRRARRLRHIVLSSGKKEATKQKTFHITHTYSLRPNAFTY